MMADKKYYAQFDGDEVDHKFYKLGEPIADSVDAGTIAFLVSQGRIGATPPGQASKDAGDLGLGDDSDPRTAQAKVLADLDPMDMTRDELIQHLAQLSTVGATDDQLRDAVFGHRENAADRAEAERLDREEKQREQGGDTDDDVRLRAILGGNLDAVKPTVAEFTDKAKLARLRELEIADKNRAGVIKAIDDKVASLEG